MKIVIAACAALALCISAAPAVAASVPQSLDAALQIKMEKFLTEEYSLTLDDGEYECDRLSFRRYECYITFSATVDQDVTFTDIYDNEVTAEEGDTVECDTMALVRRRNWGKLTLRSAGLLDGGSTKRSSRYTIEIDEPECEIVDW
jgi:hypothetical protein